MDNAELRRHLAQADQHIAEGAKHIRRQIELIAELERDGHDTERAKNLLETFEETQRTHQSHRDFLASLVGEG